MNPQTGIFLAILAMLFWGTADVFAKRVIGKIGIYRTTLANMGCGMVLLVIISLLFADIFYFPPDPLLVIIAAFLNIIGFIFYYKAFQKGKLSIASPIGNSYGLVAVLLGVFFLNEALTKIQFFFISVIIIGVILLSSKLSEFKKIKYVKGTGSALLSMIIWGFVYFFIAILTRNYDFILIALWFRILGTIFISFFIFLKKEKLFFSIKKSWIFIFPMALCDAFGFLSYALGVMKSMVSIIAPIASAAPAVTLLFARVFYKEKLEFNQKIGAFMVLLGIVALSF